MKKILLFGAGKSATLLIEYLLNNAQKENWMLTVADADIQLAASKVGNHPFGRVVSFDIHDDETRINHIDESDIIISLLPPTLHFVVAKSCVEKSKSLLTASYVDEEIRNLQPAVEKKNLLFLCEMGLDPGIDHMSAMKMIDQIRSEGGNIISFRSHCGGLVAPESDDNPWHYKLSWNPRSIVLAGKAGAHFRENGVEKYVPYEALFSTDRQVEIPDIGSLCWYPNRDSLRYASLYGLNSVQTFIRTTLRHPDFMVGWKNVIDLKLTDETPQYDTQGKTLMDFFKEHLQRNGFGDWITQKLSERFDQTKQLLENLMKLTEAENSMISAGEIPDKKIMAVDQKGVLEDIDFDEVKRKAAAAVAQKMHEANLILKQLFYLGLDDQQTQINKGFCSAADVVQLALEKKLALQPHDKDMIVMLHEIEFENPQQKGPHYQTKSLLVVKGENHLKTAMAKTVGLPLGIATKLILNGTLRLSGIQIPVKKEIYLPVLKELESLGIKFHDELKPMS